MKCQSYMGLEGDQFRRLF